MTTHTVTSLDVLNSSLSSIFRSIPSLAMVLIFKGRGLTYVASVVRVRNRGSPEFGRQGVRMILVMNRYFVDIELRKR